MKPSRSVFVITLISALMVLAFSMTPLAQAAPDKVKAAYVAIMNFAPLYVAIDRGFMKEQNIDVDMQKVASGTEAMAFLAQGRSTPEGSESRPPPSMPSTRDSISALSARPLFNRKRTGRRSSSFVKTLKTPARSNPSRILKE